MRKIMIISAIILFSVSASQAEMVLRASSWMCDSARTLHAVMAAEHNKNNAIIEQLQRVGACARTGSNENVIISVIKRPAFAGRGFDGPMQVDITYPGGGGVTDAWVDGNAVRSAAY